MRRATPSDCFVLDPRPDLGALLCVIEFLAARNLLRGQPRLAAAVFVVNSLVCAHGGCPSRLHTPQSVSVRTGSRPGTSGAVREPSLTAEFGNGVVRRFWVGILSKLKLLESSCVVLMELVNLADDAVLEVLNPTADLGGGDRRLIC